MTCATCGYPQATHEAGKCPVCACGAVPAAHEQVGAERLCACDCEVPAFMHLPIKQRCALCDEGIPHACIWARWLGHPCPGRRSTGETTAGKWLGVRQGKFKPQPEPERRRMWYGLSVPDLRPDEVVEQVVTGPPQVAARPPVGPGEFAGYQGKQAVGLGRKATERGWDARGWYWRAFDGVEGCAVALRKGVLRAVATWTRAAGKQGGKSGWGADVAYGWRTDIPGFPMQLTHTQLEGLISEDSQVG
jgi:hypothetical protein